MEKTRKTKKGYFIIFEWLMVAMLVGILILMIFWYRQNYKEVKIEEDATVIFMGEPYVYEKGTKLTMKDGSVYIDDGSKEQTTKLGDSPILLNGGTKIILPLSMSYQSGNQLDPVKKVNFYSILSKKYKGGITVDYDNKESNVVRGFLFDGNDLYIFLEPMTITVGALSYEVDALSYAKVYYQSGMELYNSKENKSIKVSADNSEMIATSERGYSIIMDKDLVRNDETEWILFSAIDNMECLE